MIQPALFFEIADEVLRSIGRGGLADAESERAAVEVRDADRVLQILAGPGSGKTEMLVWRVLYELFVRGTPAHRVIVTTFTRRAATELQVRVVERSDEMLRVAGRRGLVLNDPQVHDLRVGTIHSLCDSILAEFDDSYAEAGSQVIEEAETVIRLAKVFRFRLGYTRPPRTPRLINRLLACEELVSLFRPPWESTQWPQKTMDIVGFLATLLAQQTETWTPRCAATNVANGVEAVHRRTGLTADLERLQGRWEDYLDTEQILDFPTIQKRFLDRQGNLVGCFDHVFVDEFQDSNPIQFAIHTRWLANPEVRLTVVGDDDQAIYRFRGSDIECFRGLEPFCNRNNIQYRRETLSTNYRSTVAIVSFSQKFKVNTVLRQISLPKTISPSRQAVRGQGVRLLEGNWPDLCQVVATELSRLNVARVSDSSNTPPSAAILMFSTSERESRNWNSPALAMRFAIESCGIRCYNPRNKMAGVRGSPVCMLFGLISYLVDPVTKAQVGVGGRSVMVWGSMHDSSRAAAALTNPPSFPVHQHHVELQKHFVKSNGGDISAPASDRADLILFLDTIRTELTNLSSRPRLTLAGLVARLLAHPLFRNSGFTVDLFRQALFTQLLEANIAPTRLTLHSLDQPLEVRIAGGKYVWADRYWTLLNVFGGYLENNRLDDPEVEAFEDSAVLMITFHQAKGLEFDHVYVAGSGRDPDLNPALRTRVFSGEPVPYRVTGGVVSSTDSNTSVLALADREREVYVAITRAKQTLTILHDPSSSEFMRLNSSLASAFRDQPTTIHPLNQAVRVKEANP